MGSSRIAFPMKVRSRLSASVAVVGFALLPGSAFAEEGGSGHYLPGSMASFIDGVPLTETVIARLNVIHYTGSIATTQPLPIAGATALGVEGTAWLVEIIAGLGVIDRAQTTIRFDVSGRVSGSTGCNRFTGAVTLEGEALKFGPLATTRRACVPALMDQEQNFLKAIEAVRSYSVDASGLLHLKGANGEPLLRLVPMARQPLSKSGTIALRS